MRQALIIAGPTCSGKSALAMAMAVRLGGTVINADSMQVYRELPILTARPSAADEAAVPHALYGVRAAAEPGSAAWWRKEALAAMAASPFPILCGGTGLYFEALTHGLADIPEPSEAHRRDARDLLDREGPAALHARLTAADPQTAAGLRPSDGQRLARAWEVWRSTGRGLAWWQTQKGEQPPYSFGVIRLDPAREALQAAAAVRFDAMLAAGALDEVQALLDRGLDPALPAMRAHGVQELAAHLRGEAPLADARMRAVVATHRYIKRQQTWFRNRKIADQTRTRIIQTLFRDDAQFSDSEWWDFTTFVCNRG